MSENNCIPLKISLSNEPKLHSCPFDYITVLWSGLFKVNLITVLLIWKPFILNKCNYLTRNNRCCLKRLRQTVPEERKEMFKSLFVNIKYSFPRWVLFGLGLKLHHRKGQWCSAHTYMNIYRLCIYVHIHMT